MTSQDLLADRYGAPSPRRRRLVVVASALLAAGFLAWLGWAVWAQSTPQVTSDLVSREPSTEHATTVSVQVRMDEGVRATCTLRAYAEDHTVVGELVFDPVTPGRHTEVVRTERQATSVELLGCTAPGQDRPR